YEWVANWHRELDPNIRSRHHQSGTQFNELTETSAYASTMLLSTAQHAGEASPRVKLTGIYHDRCRKTPVRCLIPHPSLPHHFIESVYEGASQLEHIPAATLHNLPRDPPGFVAGEKGDGSGYAFGLAQPSQRGLSDHLIKGKRAVIIVCHLGFGDAGRDGV